MDETDAVGGGADTGDSLPDRGTDFEPEADPDDVFFAVVRTDHLSEVGAVHRPTDGNAVFLVREGVGLKARGRSYHCYWYEVEIPEDAFELFAPTDSDYWVDPRVLDDAVAETRADVVGIHGKPDGKLLLRNRGRTYDLRADDLPIMEYDTDEDDLAPGEPTADLRRTDRREPGRFGNDPSDALVFTVDAADLRTLAAADDDHDHLAVTIDAGAGTAEWFYYDNEGDTRTVELSLGPDDFQSPPSPVADELDVDAVVQSPVCRNALDHATEPMRGGVELGIRDSPLEAGWLQYARGDGALPVYGSLAWRSGARDTLQNLVNED